MTLLFRQVRVRSSDINRGYEVTFRSNYRALALPKVQEFKARYGNGAVLLHGGNPTSHTLAVSFRDLGMAALFKLTYGGIQI